MRLVSDQFRGTAMRLALGLGFGLAVVLPGATALAQAAGNPPQAQGGGDNTINAPVYDIAPAYAKASYFRAQYTQAMNDLTMTVIHLRREYESSPDYLSAVRDANDASMALDAARVPVLQRVYDDPQYKQSAQKMANVQEAMQDPKMGYKDRIDLAARKMEYGSAMRRMESDALGADNDVRAAQARMIEAHQHLDDLKNRFEATLYQNPADIVARHDVENARLNMLAADAYLAGALETRAYVESADMRRYQFSTSNYNPSPFYWGNPYYNGPYGFGR